MTETTQLPNLEEVVAGLSERGLPIWGALVVAPQIAALRSPLREAFLRWWEEGQLPDVSVQGQSVKSLVDSGLHPLAALLSLDALEQNSNAIKGRTLQEDFVPIKFDDTYAYSSGEKG